MPISPLRIKAPKPVATPQCSAPVDPPSHAPAWRRERYMRLRPSYDPDCCQRDSSVVIDGKTYCRLHAGGIALDRWLRGEIK